MLVVVLKQAILYNLEGVATMCTSIHEWFFDKSYWLPWPPPLSLTPLSTKRNKSSRETIKAIFILLLCCFLSCSSHSDHKTWNKFLLHTTISLPCSKWWKNRFIKLLKDLMFKIPSKKKGTCRNCDCLQELKGSTFAKRFFTKNQECAFSPCLNGWKIIYRVFLNVWKIHVSIYPSQTRRTCFGITKRIPTRK
jgi:hypothetical protein